MQELFCKPVGKLAVTTFLNPKLLGEIALDKSSFLFFTTRNFSVFFKMSISKSASANNTPMLLPPHH